MKKTVLIVLILAISAGFAGASGLDMHFGMGYNAQFFGDYADLDTSFSSNVGWMPYGVGAYAGIGYGFGARNLFNIGVEPAVNMGFNFKSDVAIANILVHARAYIKFKFASQFTLAAYGGYAWNIFGGTSNGAAFNFNEWAPLVGGRLTLLFLYAQYDVTFYQDPSLPLHHNFGIGFAFKK